MIRTAARARCPETKRRRRGEKKERESSSIATVRYTSLSSPCRSLCLEATARVGLPFFPPRSLLFLILVLVVVVGTRMILFHPPSVYEPSIPSHPHSVPSTSAVGAVSVGVEQQRNVIVLPDLRRLDCEVDGNLWVAVQVEFERQILGNQILITRRNQTTFQFAWVNRNECWTTPPWGKIRWCPWCCEGTPRSRR